MKNLNLHSWSIFFIITCLVVIHSPSIGQEAAIQSGAVQKKFWCMPLAKSEEKGSEQKILNKYGVPFINDTLTYKNGSAQIDIRNQVKHIYLLGMAESNNGRVWREPNNFSLRYFVGDDIGNIKLNYADGTTQVFPLKMGESIWWGKLFYEYQEPFPNDAKLRETLKASLRLYPQIPIEDGNYVAVITPKPVLINNIVVECSPSKQGIPIIAGMTIEPVDNVAITGGTPVLGETISGEFKEFVQTKSLRLFNQNEAQANIRLKNFRQALYTNNDLYKATIPQKIPPNYSGPIVSFSGNNFANILTNVFYHNVLDIISKIDSDGTFHSSSKNAILFAGNGLGTYRKNVGEYYNEAWSRDLGRCLQEISVLGYIKEVSKCTDFCFQTARLWEEMPSLKVNNTVLPRHWSRIINKPTKSTSQENDGHGLIAMFLYKYWQRIPNRNQWLHDHWIEIKAAGDWIPWQFEHPEITGASNGVLHTTGESTMWAGGGSVFADFICINALQCLAEMADSYGDAQTAEHWRDRANKMYDAIHNYIVSDPEYGKIWTLNNAGWAYKATVLGPLFSLADHQGFAPNDDDTQLRGINEAAYQRLINTYNKPFGFYGEGMGYGQSFITQSALLLDRMQDATTMLRWMAKAIYDPRLGSFIVPEGCQTDSTGKYWYRNGDLGNGVQEAEVIKTLRIVIGVDDTHPDRLQFFPRMPYDWNKIEVEKYPVLYKQQGKMETIFVKYKLERKADHMNLVISSDKDLGEVAFRLGPFSKNPGIKSVLVNGKYLENSVEKGGDSWWTRFTMPVKSTQ